MQAHDVLALADTIEVLNDDDALEPAASCRSKSLTSQRQTALQILQESKAPHVDLLAVVLRDGEVGFGKVIKLIYGLHTTPRKEQDANTEKKEWCEGKIDKTEDDKNSTNRKRKTQPVRRNFENLLCTHGFGDVLG